MKSRIKKQRKGDSSRERGMSHLAQQVLQQQSDFQQYQTFSNSFLYPHKPTLDEKEEKLTTWIPNASKQEPPHPQKLKQSKMRIIREKIPNKSDIFLNKNPIKTQKYHHRFCQTHDKQQRKPAKVRYVKTETPRARCAISLISPKFNSEPIEPVASPHLTTSYFSNHPMRDTIRERKALFIRKIKRDLIHGYQSRSAERHNYSTIREKQKETQRLQTKKHPLKCCTQLQLNFCNTKLTIQNQRLYRQELVIKIEPPNSQKHSRTVKNRIFLNPKAYCDNPCEPGFIRLTEQFQKLKSLLKREKNTDT